VKISAVKGPGNPLYLGKLGKQVGISPDKELDKSSPGLA